jgi:type II secretory pathway component PulM|tara:strand:+ start:654 stop:758 length:105 start_codon:yes stop_codon:yes gene_type:complete
MEKIKYFWKGLTKRGKILVIAGIVIVAVIAYGQF